MQFRRNRRDKFIYVTDAGTPGARATSVNVKSLLETGVSRHLVPSPNVRGSRVNLISSRLPNVCSMWCISEFHD